MKTYLHQDSPTREDSPARPVLQVAGGVVHVAVGAADGAVEGLAGAVGGAAVGGGVGFAQAHTVVGERHPRPAGHGGLECPWGLMLR